MLDTNKRLFVGMKISKQLQSGLDSPAPGTDRYFKEDNTDYLQIVSVGEDKLIGRFLRDGLPVHELENIGRNIRSIVSLITRGQRLEEDSVRIYIR
jgi:hypothetical protein